MGEEGREGAVRFENSPEFLFISSILKNERIVIKMIVNYPKFYEKLLWKKKNRRIESLFSSLDYKN